MRITLLTFIFLIFFCLQAQEIKWQEEAKQTYIFEITSIEAEKFVKYSPNDSLHIKKMLHTPRGSFSEKWKEKPQQGHFIFVEIDKGKVNYRYASIIPFQVFVVQEYGAFTIQIVDAGENLRNDAKVFIRRPGFWRRWVDIPVSFDKRSRTYTLNGYNIEEKELLMIELDGFCAIFDLSKNLISPRYRSSDNYNKIPDFYSYLVTDKNRYKPGETVRFKSYSLYGNSVLRDGYKEPLNSKLEVWLRTDPNKWNSYKKIDEVLPYRPGGYAGEIALHDSLQLKLDNHYLIQLRDKRGRIVAKTGFRYEDYELFDSRLETKLNYDHYAPHSNSLEINALDVNGLFLQDMQAEIIVTRGHVMKAFTNLLQLPDTLMYKKIDLENEKTTIAEIPANLFGESNCRYNVEVKVLTHDSQALISKEHATFYKSSYEIVTFTRNDTVCFQWQELGKAKNIQAEFWLNNSKERKIVELPFELPFNQSVKHYNFKIDSLNFVEYFSTVSFDNQLDVSGGFSGNSLQIKLVNPLKIELLWYIYRGERLLAKGSGTEFDSLFQKTNLEMVHYVDFFYRIGDIEQSYRKTFVPNVDFLDVSIDLPDRIYPGQTIDATIAVKDIWGKPVEDVDITAFAYNSPLEYNVPDLPDYGISSPQTREKRPDYSMREKKPALSVPFHYSYWNKKLCLDTLEYYQFTFPRNKMFLYTVNTPDTTTQIAPYMMKNGEMVNVYVIEINEKPVYFSWTEQPKRYSFLISDSSKQKITFRLHDRAIILDSLYFETGKKTILSIDLDSLPQKAKTLMLDTRDKNGRYQFTNAEKKTYQNFISRFPVTSYHTYIYLKQESVIYPIFNSCFQSSRHQVLAGPFPQGYMEYCGGIRYRHEGGFSYKFEDNVVYKYPLETNPASIRFSSTYNITTLNDFAFTPKIINQMIENCKKEKPWYPRIVRISQRERAHSNIILDIDLPMHPDSVGVSNLIFRNVETRQVIRTNRRVADSNLEFNTIPPATYDVVLLYDDGSFIHFDSLMLLPYTYTKLNMTHLPLQEKDSFSLLFRERSTILSNVPTKEAENSSYIQSTKEGSRGGSTIKGEVKSLEGVPIPYLMVLLKQDGRVVNGAYTDDRGAYQIFGIPAGIYDLTAGGTANCPNRHTETGIYISSSEVKFVFLVIDCSATELDEVVIAHVPPLFSQDNTSASSRLTGAEVRKTPGRSINAALSESEMSFASVRGNRSNGEQIIIDGVRVRGQSSEPQMAVSKNIIYKLQNDEIDNEFENEPLVESLYYELMQLNSLRTNFSDVGFWEPKLYTDPQGEAKFTVTFPDNITQWNTIVYAMNRKLQTATLRKNIRSYKPLMAELRTPQFLVAGDTAYYAGNIRNYTQDREIAGHTLFIIGEDTTSRKEIRFFSSYQDKITVTSSSTDSLTATYVFLRDDGYSDGEKRTIPVIPRGTEIADGTLLFLKPGDKKTISAGENEEIQITLTANPLDIYVSTTLFLRNYRYDCNEQLASKLIGLLNYKLYQQYAGERFKEDKRIENIIKKLVKNKNENNLWSWWGNSPNSNFWMSAHIFRALISAHKAGYAVNLDFTNIEQDYVNTGRYRSHSLRDIAILNALSGAGTKQNYAAAIEMFEKEIAQKEHQADSIARAQKTKNYTSYLNEKLLLLEIRQQQNIGYSSDSIKKYLKTDVLGAVYCDDETEERWHSNTFANTLIAYRIISSDSALQHLKESVQVYILRTKERGWNTWQASSAVMAILPDLLAESANKETPSTVLLSGKEQKELSEFPYTTTLYAGEQLDIFMKSGIPLIYSDYQLKRVTTAHTGDAFKIETRLNKENLIAGEESTLHVTLQVKQANAEHVMIEIPIPAGCSYASKRTNRYKTEQETYREHFKDKVVIFCEKLPIGAYEYSIALLPRYSGNYHLNPAKVEMMYFPVIYSNNEERKVEITN